MKIRLAQAALALTLASAAIPSIFPPVLWNGELLIDGGVANNTPISHAVALGADEIYVLPAGFACDLTAPPPTAFGVGMHALSLLIHHRLMHETAALQGQVRLVVLPSPCPLDVTPIDFQHSDILIARGAAGARTVLDIRDSSGHGGHDHSPPST